MGGIDGNAVRVVADVDFMSRGYAVIAEPLNLLVRGQEWFVKIYRDAGRQEMGKALVLGATPWIIQLVAGTCPKVVVVDMSSIMLREARDALPPEVLNVEFVKANWLEFVSKGGEFDLVIGDNALSYLRFSDEWEVLIDGVARMLRRGGNMLFRVLSVPSCHKSESVEEIVTRHLGENSVNYTEVRARLLFAEWNSATFAIETEEVYKTFEERRAVFEPLFAKFGSSEVNDLVTVRKYKEAGAVYYAPPLGHILTTLGERFRVRQVHFGPYAMKEYFPLIVLGAE